MILNGKKMMFLFTLFLMLSCDYDQSKDLIQINVQYPNTGFEGCSEVVINNQSETPIYIPASKDSTFVHIVGRRIGTFEKKKSSIGIADYFGSVLIPIKARSKRKMLVCAEPLSNLDTIEYYFQYYLDTAGLKIIFHDVTYLVKDSSYLLLRDTVVAKNYE